VVRGGRARLQEVQAGHSNGLETEVLEGLREGDTVVLHPSDKIADGVAVRAR
jgi:HlyD family secretion protein